MINFEDVAKANIKKHNSVTSSSPVTSTNVEIGS